MKQNESPRDVNGVPSTLQEGKIKLNFNGCHIFSVNTVLTEEFLEQYWSDGLNVI